MGELALHSGQHLFTNLEEVSSKSYHMTLNFIFSVLCKSLLHVLCMYTCSILIHVQYIALGSMHGKWLQNHHPFLKILLWGDDFIEVQTPFPLFLMFWEHVRHMPTWLVFFDKQREDFTAEHRMANHFIWFWIPLHYHPVVLGSSWTKCSTNFMSLLHYFMILPNQLVMWHTSISL